MRKLARESAFQIIFAMEFGTKMTPRYQMEIFKRNGLDEEDCLFARKLIALYTKHREELMSYLEGEVIKFAPNRIYPVDRAVLLVALSEIRYMNDVPPIVSVNEAVGIAKKYSTENSAGFVNGILAGAINS